jgi:hypothetical protein
LHGTDFHAGYEDISRQIIFSFCRHHLVPCLPIRAVPDYFLWGYIKSKVDETHPANIDDIKQ